MAIVAEEKMVNEGGSEKRKFSVTFDNGTLEQIEELKTFFKQTQNVDVIKLAVSLLQRAKEEQEKLSK